jgi:large repetitive protein
VAVNSTGTLFVADTQNHRITKGTPTHLYIPPTITTAALLPAGAVGQGYSQTLAATGGTTPYTWTLVSGALPSGLTLSPGGVIGGTLGTLPTVTFTARVTGGDNAFAERIFTIDAPPTIATESPLPSGTVGTMYPSQQLKATGGATPYTWAIASGSLPPGLSLNTSNGYIYGTPTLATNALFVVRATSGSGLSSTKSLNLTVIPVIASPAQLPAGTVGAAYSQTLAATGGTAPYVWVVAPGSSLPPGWNLTGGGVLTGTPGDGTAFSFTVQVTDSNGVSTAKIFLLSFKPAAPTIVTGSLLRSGSVGLAYNEVLAVEGGTAPYGWTLLSGSLPSGLSLGGGGSVAGVINGVPEAETTARFRVKVTAQNGLTATKSFRLTIDPTPVATELYAFANFVGQPGTPGSADGVGSAAQLNFPSSMVLDNTGMLYVMDSWNNTIRKVTPAGTVTTFAGSAGVSGSTDGTVSEARFSFPRNGVMDNAGNLFITDSSNHTIRKITPAGIVTTLAGIPGVTGKTDGTGSEARFYYPCGIVSDGGGTFYVADAQNCTIRKVTPAGVVTTFVGSAGLSGKADGTGSAARFNFPTGIALDSMGNLFVMDEGNNTIRKVTPAGVVTTIAGSPWISSSDTGVGSADGTGTTARFNNPYGVAIDHMNNLFVTDYFNDTIRKVTPAAVVTTIAGAAGVTGSTDGTGSTARFYQPIGVTVDAAGTLYVADARNHRISKGTPLYPQPMITKSNPLPEGMASRIYNQALTVRGGTAPYTWSVVSGILPAGLNLGGDGVIAGTPGAAATADFTVQVTDSGALSATKAFRLTVNPTLTITTIDPLPIGTVGAAYHQTLTAGGGGAFYTWSIAGGTLPAGLNLNGDGVIAGTLESTAPASFTARVTDIDGLSAMKAFSIAVHQPPTIITASPLPAGAVGAAYSQTLTAGSGTEPYAWSIASGSGSLPSGLTLSSGGVIGGTPDTKTTAGFTVRVTGANALSSTKVFSLTINLRGDINDDSRVDLADAILVMQVLSDTIPAASVHPGADVDNDAQIGLPEAVYILQKLSGLR